MSSFDEIVSKETVASFGIDMSVWDDKQQAQLHEAMTIAWKEKPDWTEKEAKHRCLQHIMAIHQEWFEENMGFLVKQTNQWYSLDDAFEEFVQGTLKDFIMQINKQMEFTKFCELFYDELRERYNVGGTEMREEFAKMKEKGWTFSDYKKDLKKRK
jgi:hypothetical protein